MSPRVRRTVVAALLGLIAVMAGLLSAGPAAAHGFSSTVYVDVTAGDDGHVRTELELEYDLLVVSTADYRHDDPLFRAGTAAFDAGDTAAQTAALNTHAESVVGYVTERFSVTSDGGLHADPGRRLHDRRARGRAVRRPAARLGLPDERLDGHEVRSGLFPDAEGYVKGTKTIVTYEIDGRSGSAALDAEQPVLLDRAGRGTSGSGSSSGSAPSTC